MAVGGWSWIAMWAPTHLSVPIRDCSSAATGTMARQEAEAEVDFHMDSEDDEEGLMNEAEDAEDEEVRAAPAYRPPAAGALGCRGVQQGGQKFFILQRAIRIACRPAAHAAGAGTPGGRRQPPAPPPLPPPHRWRAHDGARCARLPALWQPGPHATQAHTGGNRTLCEPLWEFCAPACLHLPTLCRLIAAGAAATNEELVQNLKRGGVIQRQARRHYPACLPPHTALPTQ